MADTKEIKADKKLEFILEAIKEKKGKDIISIDLRNVSNSIADYFIICHGDSTTQVDAIADEIEDQLKKEAKIRPHHIEGRDNSQWILLDYFDILVHVFIEEKRAFFNLEELWADGDIEKIEDKK